MTAKKTVSKNKKASAKKLMEPMTFAAFAEAVGVSRMTVYRRVTCDKMLQSYVTTTPDGKMRIDRTAMRFFKDCNTLSHPVTCDSNVTVTCYKDVTSNVTTPNGEKVIELLQKNLEFLQNQLTEKDRQLAEKDKRIAELTDKITEALHGAQQAQINGQVLTALNSGHGKRFYRGKGW